MMNLNYPMDNIFLKILKIVFSVWLKNETPIILRHKPTSIELKIKSNLKSNLSQDAISNF